MTTELRTAAALAVILLASTAVEARPHRHGPTPISNRCDNNGKCFGAETPESPAGEPRRRLRRQDRLAPAQRATARPAASAGAETVVLGGRPAACSRPKARFRWCGCAAAQHVGLPNPTGHWDLASNWFQLPRAAPGPNMAAVRSGHVVILKRHLGGSTWLAYDPNSGGQLARLHPIDLRRYTAVVDPSRAPGRRAEAANPPVPLPRERPAPPYGLLASASPDLPATEGPARTIHAIPGLSRAEPAASRREPSGPPLRGMRLTSASPEIVLAIEEARDTVVRTATAGGTMLKHGVRKTIERMQPVFIVRLSRAIEEARADQTTCATVTTSSGWKGARRRVTVTERCLARVGCYSGYRQPGDGVGGYRDKFDSNHAYGLACDMYGIGRPGSKAAKLWHEIATKHGLHNPYGTNHRKEWNHYQATPAVKAIARVPELRKTITKQGPIDVVRMWRVADLALYLPKEHAFPKKYAKLAARKVHARKRHHRRLAAL